MSYRISLQEMYQNSRIVVVGCGGTGGFVAEGLCRLLGKLPAELLLVDYDRVEPHNLRRQNFYPGDEGKYKSQALAERLAGLYGRRVAYSNWPYDPELVGHEMGSLGYSRAIQGIIIGCVDNAQARRDIARGMDYGNWWIDAGNSENSGQVLIGNATSVERLEHGFNEDEQIVSRLPAPSLQLPALLAPISQPARSQRDCAEDVEDNRQDPFINQAMATWVLEFAYRLLLGQLTWMGVYLSLDTGTTQVVPAEPQVVARMCGVKVDYLMGPVACSRGLLRAPRRR